MALITAVEVRQIMDNCTLDDDTVEVYIDAASELVSCVFINDTTITDTLRKEIERWFTAHMIACTRWKTASEEKIQDAEIVYTGKWGMGLSSTPYGQMVLQLDVTGKMSKMGKSGVGVYTIPNFDD